MKILAHAQELIYQLLDGMPGAYQRQSLKPLLELFLKAQGAPLPDHWPRTQKKISDVEFGQPSPLA